MDKNFIVVAGREVPVGPMLQHIMLSSMEVQNALLSMAGTVGSRVLYFDIPNDYHVKIDVRVLSVHTTLEVICQNDREKLVYEYIGGDAWETYILKVESQAETILFFDGNLESDREDNSTPLAGLSNIHGESLKIPPSDIEAYAEDDGWEIRGMTWEHYYDAGLQRYQRETMRRAA